MATKAELKKIFVTGAIPKETDFHNLIDVAGEQGPQGKPGTDGTDGKQGPQGEPGADGADGFGTEEQYNAIISRLDELEAPPAE